MKCYFCSLNLMKDEHDPIYSSYVTYQCETCADTNNLFRVTTSYSLSTMDILYANLYIIVNLDNSLVYLPRIITPVNIHQRVKLYLVQLYVQENYTKIISSQGFSQTYLQKIPNVQLTPSNVIQKVKLYLTFS
jgi:hypothetical protein